MLEDYIGWMILGIVALVEDEIARQRYTHDNISQEFNTMMDIIPLNFIGRVIGFSRLEYLQFEGAIATPPKIEF